MFGPAGAHPSFIEVLHISSDSQYSGPSARSTAHGAPETLIERVNYRIPEVYDNPFKNLVKINIFIEKCAADGPHSRPSPGLGQGPGSSGLHFFGLNLKVVGKHDPA